MTLPLLLILAALALWFFSRWCYAVEREQTLRLRLGMAEAEIERLNRLAATWQDLGKLPAASLRRERMRRMGLEK